MNILSRRVYCINVHEKKKSDLTHTYIHLDQFHLVLADLSNCVLKGDDHLKILQPLQNLKKIKIKFFYGIMAYTCKLRKIYLYAYILKIKQFLNI